MLRHLKSGLLNPLGDGFAAAEKNRAKQEIARKQQASGAAHFFQVHCFYSNFAPGANQAKQLRWRDRLATFPAIMIELEVYARGLRDLNKILELDLQLEPIAGLYYKIDTNHDLVYFEFDRPTVSLREIRAIFLKLGLDPLFIGAIPPELRPRTKTEPLTA
jgi:hypothetical protein